MARGYLANWKSVPPLIFRFQFNPELLQEKKSYKYEDAANFGSWEFQTGAAATSERSWLVKLFTVPYGIYEDIRDGGPHIAQTKPLEAREGGQRSFSIDFQLDSRVAGEEIDPENANPYGGTIEPDLAILRSFVNPTIDISGVIGRLTGEEDARWFTPPECNLIYGGLSVTCVMTDLNIKITAFNPDHSPQRADVSVTLKHQTKSVDPAIEFFTRNFQVGKSYTRDGFGEDYVNVLPGVSAIRHTFEI